MRRHLTFLLLAGVVALSACRSKPKKKVAEFPEEPPVVGHSGKVRLRSVESESEAGKGSAGRAKPKAGVAETAPAATVMKKDMEPKPPSVAKPDNAPVPPPAPSQPPKVKAVEVAKPGDSPMNAPAKVPAASERGSQPVSVKVIPVAVEQPATVPQEPSSPAAVRNVKPADGRPVELSVPAKSPATALTAAPLRTMVPTPVATEPKPAAVGPMLGLIGIEPRPRVGGARSLPLPTGGGAADSGSPIPPLALQFGQGTNPPSVTNGGFKAIGVDPLLQGSGWREEQLARQAAEQKAREEEQQKLKGALYRFLFKGGTNR